MIRHFFKLALRNLYKQEIFQPSAYYAVNADFFEVFDFKVLRGDIKQALASPFAMILTESEASRIFPSENPMGQSIVWRSTTDFTFTVEAIVQDVPQNSSIQFKGLISEASTKKMTPHYPDNWAFGVYETYLLLNPEVAVEALELKLRSFLIDYYETELAGSASDRALTQPPSHISSVPGP